jgi:CO/xanthine dehydrogenase FAD-binding subunit
MYYQPRTVEEAVRLLGETGASILAGGTDFYPALGDRPLARPVLDIAGIGALRDITRDGEGWRIAANATWTDLQRAPLPPLFDGIVAAAREVGSIQIQNAATVVGNVCNASPAADGVPCLMAMDARVEIAGSAGSRVVPIADFVLGSRRTALAPGEFVTALLVPDAGNAAGRVGSSFEKLGARRYLVISIVSVAAVIAVEAGLVADARVAVGACSAAPRRLAALEAALVGLPADGTTVAGAVRADHLSPLSPIDDVRGTAAYRIDCGLVLVRRALARALPATSADGGHP